MKTSKQKGFTLVELLIVIAIIGILMSLALAGMRFAQRRARDLQRENAIRNLSTALEAYYVDNRAYPAGSVSVATLVEGGADPYLSAYLENTFELPQGVAYEDIGYVSSTDNLTYLVCVFPENSTSSADMMSAGTNTDLENSCFAEISQ